MNIGKETRRMKFGLGRIRAALKSEGFKNAFESVIVAGSSGKSQTAVFLEQFFTGAEVKTGTYISPHLFGIGERVRIDGNGISDSLYYSKMRRLKKYKLTYFERLTAAAFLYFEEKRVAQVVAEVGLGGRLDAVNVLKNSVSVITNICREHTGWLGNTEEKIAREKAGIIKKGNTVVTLARGRALEVIKNIAKKKNSVVVIPRVKKMKYGAGFLDENYALALAAFRASGYTPEAGFRPERILPSRFEKVKVNRATVVIDGGHTLSAAKRIAGEAGKLGSSPVCLFYALRDKKIEEMLPVLCSSFGSIIFAPFPHERGLKPHEIKRRIPARLKGSVVTAGSMREGLARAVAMKPSGILCFGSLLGSAYLKKIIYGGAIK